MGENKVLILLLFSFQTHPVPFLSSVSLFTLKKKINTFKLEYVYYCSVLIKTSKYTEHKNFQDPPTGFPGNPSRPPIPGGPRGPSDPFSPLEPGKPGFPWKPTMSQQDR